MGCRRQEPVEGREQANRFVENRQVWVSAAPAVIAFGMRGYRSWGVFHLALQESVITCEHSSRSGRNTEKVTFGRKSIPLLGDRESPGASISEKRRRFRASVLSRRTTKVWVFHVERTLDARLLQTGAKIDNCGPAGKSCGAIVCSGAYSPADAAASKNPSAPGQRFSVREESVRRITT